MEQAAALEQKINAEWAPSGGTTLDNTQHISYTYFGYKSLFYRRLRNEEI